MLLTVSLQNLEVVYCRNRMELSQSNFVSIKDSFFGKCNVGSLPFLFFFFVWFGFLAMQHVGS